MEYYDSRTARRRRREQATRMSFSFSHCLFVPSHYSFKKSHRQSTLLALNQPSFPPRLRPGVAYLDAVHLTPDMRPSFPSYQHLLHLFPLVFRMTFAPSPDNQHAAPFDAYPSDSRVPTSSLLGPAVVFNYSPTLSLFTFEIHR